MQAWHRRFLQNITVAHEKLELDFEILCPASLEVTHSNLAEMVELIRANIHPTGMRHDSRLAFLQMASDRGLA